uniref:Uncharacterized protein n=1 Tax=Nocardia terpenica TaxID=455432 RepID=A0A809Q794_9NOCA|nr:hypothetical protein [Nocardia terpenica]
MRFEDLLIHLFDQPTFGCIQFDHDRTITLENIEVQQPPHRSRRVPEIEFLRCHESAGELLPMRHEQMFPCEREVPADLPERSAVCYRIAGSIQRLTGVPPTRCGQRIGRPTDIRKFDYVL